MRVLYVEDNATNVILVQRVANMGKHEVINYADGQDALDRFEQDKPDLILLDVQLRGALTGLDVARILRSKGCIIPVIAVTAYAMKGDRQLCLDAGCDDYLAKPVSVAELVTIFKRYGDAAASGKPITSTYKVPVVTPVSPEVVSSQLSQKEIAAKPEVVPVEAAPSELPLKEVTPKVAVVPVEAVPSEPVQKDMTSKADVTPVEVVPVAAESTPSVAPTPAVPMSSAAVADSPPSSPVEPVAYRAPTPVNAEP